MEKWEKGGRGREIEREKKKLEEEGRWKDERILWADVRLGIM